MDEEAALVFVTFGTILIFFLLPYFRYPRWESDRFSSYIFEPDFPSSTLWWTIPIGVLCLSPLIYRFAPEIWATIGIWWLAFGIILELCCLWLIYPPSCRNCGRSTEAYRKDTGFELSYYYVCQFCRHISRRSVSAIGGD